MGMDSMDMNMKFYSISKTSEILGISTSTLRLYDKRGIFVPERRTEGKRRLYSEKQINDFLTSINGRLL